MNLKHPIDLRGFIQIGIMVPDIEKARHEWAELLGVPVPGIVEQPKPDGPIPNLKYRGKDASYGLKLAMIHAPQGFVIELHQMTDDGDSTFREYVRKHGYGVHHLAFEVGDARDAIVEELTDRGYEMRTVGDYPGSSWTIVDSEDKLGVNLNIKPVR